MKNSSHTHTQIQTDPIRKKIRVFPRSSVSLSIFAFLFITLLVIFLPAPVFAAPTERVLRVEAGNYAFSPSVLKVNPGDRVTIELVAKDVAHGLTIDGYPVDLHAVPGQTARVTFTASRAGAFKLRCSIACGNLHPFMTGKFEVGPNLLLARAAVLALLVVGLGIWKMKNA